MKVDVVWLAIYKESGVYKYKAVKFMPVQDFLGIFETVTVGGVLMLLLAVPRYLSVSVGVGILRSIACFGSSFGNLFQPCLNADSVLRRCYVTSRGSVVVLCPLFVDKQYGTLMAAKRWEGAVGFVTHPDYIAPFAQVLIGK
jgi:hypothetical protein